MTSGIELVLYFVIGVWLVSLPLSVIIGIFFAVRASSKSESWIPRFLISLLGPIGWIVVLVKNRLSSKNSMVNVPKSVDQVSEENYAPFRPRPGAGFDFKKTADSIVRGLNRANLLKPNKPAAIVALSITVLLVLVGTFSLLPESNVVQFSSDDTEVDVSVGGGWKSVGNSQGLTLEIPENWSLDSERVLTLTGSKDSGMVAVRSGDSDAFVWPLFISDYMSEPDVEVLLNAYASKLFPSQFPEAIAVNDSLASTTAAGGSGLQFLTLSLIPSRAGIAAYLFGGSSSDLYGQSDVFSRIINSVKITGQPLAEVSGPQFETAFDSEENSFSVQVPSGWAAELKVNRRSSSDFRPSVVLTSPDQRIRVIWSGISASAFHDKYAVTGLIIHRPGDVVSAIDGTTRIIRDLVGSDTLVRETVPRMAEFGSCNETLITQLRDRSDIATIVKSQWKGFVVNANYDATSADFTCADKVGRVTIVNEVQGYSQYDATLNTQMALWGPKYFDGFVSPTSDAAFAEYVIATIYETFTINPEWFARQLNSDAALSDIVARSGREISDIVSRGYEGRQDYSDILSQRRSDATLGIERLNDPFSGRTYEVQSGSNYYWVDDKGTVAGTETSVAPNIDFRRLVG